jgi:hypothetical protein
MFTGRPVTGAGRTHNHVRVFALRSGAAVAHALTVAAVSLSLLAPAATAHAAQLPAAVGAAAKPAPTPAPTANPGGTANDGAADGRITFGMTTASGGTTDARGFIAVNAPAGSVLYDNVAVINLSDAPLDVDLYTADVTNGSDGTLDVGAKTDTPKAAGSWVTLPEGKVTLPAQSSKTGPGFQVIPVTITIPKNAEPGDHLAAVLSSVTAQGKPGDNAPALNLEHRVGVRVYVTVQGDIRPGLTIHDVKTHFLAGSAFGSGTMEVEYTLTNSGNVRFGVKPSVRATGPFGLAPHSADGTAIGELLPHSSVTQKVTLSGVFPLVLENVVVSAEATPALGGSEPGVGTVHASSWMWLWTWLLLVVVLLVGAGVLWWQVRRRRNRPGVWGPPEGLWGSSTKPSDAPVNSAPQPKTDDKPANEPVSAQEHATAGAPAPDAEPEHGPEREPVR